MIIEEYIDIIAYYENDIIFYNNLGYDCKKRVTFTIKVEDLKKSSTFILNCKCEKCDKIVKREYRKYLNNKDNHYFSCSSKCGSDKMKLTCLEKYGVEHVMYKEEFKNKLKETNIARYGTSNVFQSKSIKEKIKNTNLERYGCEHPMKSDKVKNKVKETNLERYGNVCSLYGEEVKEKTEQTCLERYGFKNPAKSDIIKDKIKNTVKDKYGVEYTLQLPEIREKIKQTLIKKYGVDHYFKSKEYKDILIKDKFENYISLGLSKEDIISISEPMEIHCNECSKNYIAKSYLIYQRLKYFKSIPCTNCNPINSSLESIKEKELFEYISSIYENKIIQNDRTILSPNEIDIYLPDIYLAFEFNGSYWHSDMFKNKDYHLNKTNKCISKGIRLIHIYEDDWNNKQDIIKAKIFNTINTLSKNVEYNIRNVNFDDSKVFINNNSLGLELYYNDINIGAFENDELVSLLSIRKKDDNTINILEYSTIKNIDYFVELFNYFKNSYSFNEIFYIVNKDWNDEKLYNSIGFVYNKDIDPYINGDRHKYYNSGNIEYIYNYI